MKKIMYVEGMSCNHCVNAVKDALEKIEGIAEIDVILEDKKVKIKGDNLVEDVLKEAVEEIGYDVIKID